MSSSFLNSAMNTALQNVNNLRQEANKTSANAEVRVGGYFVIVQSRLAEGGFSFVDLVLDSSSRQEYVLKRCGIQTKESMEIVQKEISLLQKYHGPYIVELLAHEIIQIRADSKEALLLLQYCPHGHLLTRLNSRNGQPLNSKDIYKIFGQVLMAVQPLHQSVPPVTHRDLKLENILFGQDGNVRLCDFGSCVAGYVRISTTTERTQEEERISKTTTQMYRAPEMVDLYMREQLTEKTDIWALGCILYALCYLTHPFRDAGTLGILSGKYTYPTSAVFASAFTKDVQVLITRMLDVDPEARPSIEEISESTRALSQSLPLPAHHLSEEALLCRAHREESEKRRLAIAAAKKPVAVPQPSKVAVPLDSNSVAARRLAAKRAGAGGASTTSLGTPLTVSSNSRQDQVSLLGEDLLDDGGGYAASTSGAAFFDDNFAPITAASTNTSNLFSSDGFFADDPTTISTAAAAVDSSTSFSSTFSSFDTPVAIDDFSKPVSSAFTFSDFPASGFADSSFSSVGGGAGAGGTSAIGSDYDWDASSVPPVSLSQDNVFDGFGSLSCNTSVLPTAPPVASDIFDTSSISFNKSPATSSVPIADPFGSDSFVLPMPTSASAATASDRGGLSLAFSSPATLSSQPLSDVSKPAANNELLGLFTGMSATSSSTTAAALPMAMTPKTFSLDPFAAVTPANPASMPVPPLRGGPGPGVGVGVGVGGSQALGAGRGARPVYAAAGPLGGGGGMRPMLYPGTAPSGSPYGAASAPYQTGLGKKTSDPFDTLNVLKK